jgi:uncharacterized iron-regulated membrane protein
MKQFALHYHRFLGVLVALLMVMFTLTGGLLVFDREVQPALHLRQYLVSAAGQPLPIQTLVDHIAEQFPQQQLEWIDLPQPNQSPVHALIQIKKPAVKTDLYLNPYTGEILGQYKRDRIVLPLLHRLHTHLLAGELGKWLVGLSGLGLVAVSITGIVRWTGWKKLSAGFKIRWSAKPKVLNYDLHNAMGIAIALFLLMIGLTGAFLGLQAPIRAVGQWAVGQAPMQAISTKSGATAPSLEVFLQTAQTEFPQAKLTRLHLPKNAKDTVRVHLKQPQETAIEGKTKVVLDQYTGKVLKVENPLTAHWFKQLKQMIDYLHTGNFGGTAIALIYLALTLLTLIVSVTGFLIWLWRTARPNRTAQTKTIT